MPKLRKKSFHFKQFTVDHDRCAMKVNTDAVVLGSYTAEVLEKEGLKDLDILDIGTGSGIIPLMLAQKIEGKISGIEVQHDAVMQAKENFEASHWSERLKVIEGCFVGYYLSDSYTTYDLLVSNPPFFEAVNTNKGNNLQITEQSRAIARFESFLPFEHLVKGAYQMLRTNGSFFVLLPYKRAIEFTALAVNHGFHLESQLDVIYKEKKAPSRVVLRLRKIPVAFHRSELILQTEERENTPAYKELTKDYYL